MRSIIALAGGAGGLLLGLWAISLQAQAVEPTLNSSAANATYNVSISVYEGVGTAGGTAVVWFGVAAVVLVACGVLVKAARGGR